MTHVLQPSIVPSTDDLALCVKTKKELTPFESHRILRIKEVCELLGYSKSTLYGYLNPKSKYYKPDFPKRVKLSQRSVGWLAADIYAYIKSYST